MFCSRNKAFIATELGSCGYKEADPWLSSVRGEVRAEGLVFDGRCPSAL